MRAPGAALPLTVIGGFLGAGKTTLLNGWLGAWPADHRVAVLLNDFGAVNIDAALVRARSADTIALTNGCVCCSIGDDLGAALMRVLDATPAFDSVVVEASGVSDPWKIAQMGLADPALCLEGIVVVVDASAVLAHAADERLASALERQVACADLLVLNKVALAGPQQAEAARRWARRCNPSAPLLDTADGLVPPWVCTSAPPGQDRSVDGRQSHGEANEHARLFESCLLRPATRFAAERLRAALACMPPGVLRLKGVVETDEFGWTEVQFAGRHGWLRPGAAPSHGCAVVGIGLRGQFSAAALAQWLGDAGMPAR